MVQLPPFVRELIWTFYPPRYKQLSEQPFHKSFSFLCKMLLVAFLLAGIIFLPKLAFLKGHIEDELGKFSTFSLSGNVTQTDRITIPRTNPWLVVDLNNNVSLTKETFVIDKDTIKYRFFGIKTVDRDHIKEPSEYRAPVSRFITLLILLMMPGVALLLYLRSLLKYFLMVLLFATLWYIIFDLSRYRLKWKQMLNICSHTIVPILLIETVSAALTTAYLLPLPFRFVGLNIYIITLALFAILTAVCIIGCQVEEKRKK
ncbi:DUF1189 domain-containing protein [Candidatus Woesearchaeota archaeon]|nr:MAG: DUF1189 domain-containing protein [Candidatus Woesearchaeota archaeon]